MSGGDPDENAGATADADPNTGADANADTEPDDAEAEEEDGPVEIGDGREKYARVYLGSGETVEHGDIYLRHSEEEFIVSPTSEFPEEETTRYAKSEVRRVEILQHHSSCFITTAAAGEGATLDALRGFRDEAMLPTRWGRALVAVYERVSPPVARTLERHPDSLATAAVARLVDRCGWMARRREAADGRITGGAYTAVLVALYVIGVLVAVVGATLLAVGEAIEAGESG